MKLQITIDGKTYAAEVEILEDESSQPGLAPSLAASASEPAQPAPGAYIPGHAAEEHSENERLYRSPVTGLVIRVNVKPGQQVQPSDVLLVLEAMKMETSITAHHAGKVKSVSVAAGDPVKLNEILIEME